MKNILHIVTIVAFLSVACLPVPAALAGDMEKPAEEMGGFSSYYQNNPTTVEQLVQKWGKPDKVVKSEAGIEKYVYKYTGFGSDEMQFIVKDGRVVGCL